MKAKKIKAKRGRSLPRITLALSRTMFAVFLLAIILITNAVAQNYYELLVSVSENFTPLVYTAGKLRRIYGEERDNSMREIPGYIETGMLDSIRVGNNYGYSFSYRGDSFSVLRETNTTMQTAVIFCDPDGNILHKSSDFIYFHYVTEDIWKDGKEEQIVSGNAWIDLGSGEIGDSRNDPYNLFRVMHSGTKDIRNIRVMRITGYMDASEIKPVKIDYYDEYSLREALGKRTPDSHTIHGDGTEEISHNYTYSGLEREGLLEWQSVFDNSAAEIRDDLVTIYAFYPEINVYDAGDKVRYQDMKFENLSALLEEHGPEWFREYAGDSYNRYGLMSSIIFGARYFYNFTDLEAWEPSEDSPTPPLEFYMVTAIESRPLATAVDKLRNVYIIILAFSLIGVLALRRLIRRNLIEPVVTFNQAVANGWTNIYTPADRPQKYNEADELLEHYQETQRTLSRNKDDITRLERAVKYAQEAEQNRRQMVANIAHELKTPLAIIHSYAEGLREHIAEDKRDKYSDIILSETERMDAMVLDMLDLSRLEAGKVKLSRDSFSLSELAASIFEKLEIAAAAKRLYVEFDFPDDCVILADEVRIGQVIENFATNAVKYTPVDGNIRVRTQSGRSCCTFAVENECLPLSAEALNKVWDTFFRTDEARSGNGTGLGLAIAKSIIDLHGGNCMVKNTSTGVEFSFTI